MKHLWWLLLKNSWIYQENISGGGVMGLSFWYDWIKYGDNVLLTAVLHFYITWVIYKQFSRRVKANCFPCYNLKIWGLGAKLCEAFLLFLFWKELRYFKVKESMVFVEQNINFNKNETKSKMESTTNSFKEINHVLQLA